MIKTLRPAFQRRIFRLDVLIQKKRKILQKLSLFRLLSFVSLIALILSLYLLKKSFSFYLLSAFPLLIFIFLIREYSKLSLFIQLSSEFREQLQREFYRSNLQLDKIYTGERDFSNYPSYFTDLDISKKNGLFTFLDTTGTKKGEEYFLENLSGTVERNAEDINYRQKQIRELSQKRFFTFKFLRLLNSGLSENLHKKLDFSSLFREQKSFFTNRKFLFYSFRPLFFISYISLFLTILLSIPGFYSSIFFLQLILSLYYKKELNRRFKAYTGISGQIGKIKKLLIYLKSNSSIELSHSALAGIDRKGLRFSIEELESILSKVSVIEAPALHFLLNFLFAWDFWQIARLESWKSKYLQQARLWAEAIQKLDALIPFAVLKIIHSEYSFPLIDSSFKNMEAKNMGHPLIPASSRISNPLDKLNIGELVLITGSNMSGKTTYLRTIGVNVLLAMCGGPVLADEFHLPPLQILTSIKNEDSLEDGISFFYAEVKRITNIVKNLQTGKYSIVLMDEIFKGTNTRERLLASRAILKELQKYNSFTFVTTHDIELAKENEDSFTNKHFSEQIIENKMSFDYKIKLGVVNSSNALKILEIEGLHLEY